MNNKLKIVKNPLPTATPPPSKQTPKKTLEFCAGLVINRQAQIKILLKEVLYNSTAQAVLKIFFTRSKLIKFIWIICLALTLSTCAPLLIRNFMSYFSYEVITTSRTIFETPTLFPKVTICNRNLFTTKYAFELLSSSNYTDVVYKMYNNYFNESERNKLTHEFGDILLACNFNGQICTHADFVPEFFKDSNCMSFNTGRNATNQNVPRRQSFRAGSSYGLKLTLYVNFYENLTRFNKYVGASIKIGNKIILFNITQCSMGDTKIVNAATEF
jgi:hypothetical protein